MGLKEELGKYWPKIVATGFCGGVLTCLITAYLGNVEVGWEIFWEVPLVIILIISAWKV